LLVTVGDAPWVVLDATSWRRGTRGETDGN